MEETNGYNPDTDLIERFLDGELTAEELENFEKRIASDAVLVQLLKDRKELQETYVRARIRESVREEVRRISGEDGQRQRFVGHFTATMRLVHRRYAIAAGILLLIGVAVAALLMAPDLRETVMAFFRGEPSVPVLREVRQEYKARRSALGAAGTVILTSGVPDTIIICREKNILFRWYGKQEYLLNFTIMDAGRGTPVFVVKLNPAGTSFLLMGGILKQGSYAWYADGKEPAGHFTIE